MVTDRLEVIIIRNPILYINIQLQHVKTIINIRIKII